MNRKRENTTQYFKSLTIIFFALVAGQVFFAVVAFFLVYTNNMSNDDAALHNAFMYVIPVIVIVFVSVSQVLFKSRITSIREKSTLIEKFTEYRTALIIRFSLIEVPVLFTFVVFLITCDLMFFYLGIILLSVFVFLKPSQDKAENELELTDKEKALLDNPDTIISEF